MDFSALLGAINVDRLSPDEFAGQIARAWRKARFAQPAHGHAGSDALGATLLKSRNFGLMTSGWFDSNSVTFPLSLLPTTAEGILNHLKWMIDSRQNNDAVAYLWSAVNKHLPTLKAKKGGPKRQDLERIASRLTDALRSQPELARALLTGRLGDAIAWFENPHHHQEWTAWGSLAWSMIIIWALFDLQIVAYRLFHPEWFALEGDRAQPQPMTGRTLEKLAKELLKFAVECQDEFAKGRGLKTVSADLASFIKDHNLVQHARRQVALLGISSNPAISDLNALKKYLSFLSRLMPKLLTQYDLHGQKIQTHLVSELKYKFSRGKGQIKKGKLIDKSAASMRFDVPALTAMLFAIENVIADLSTGSVLPVRSCANLGLKARGQATAVRNLFGIYRGVFVRSPHDYNAALNDSIEDYRRLAQASIDQSKGDPGLEPMTAGAMRPWLGGVPTAPQLASGGEDEGINELEPDTWVANYPSSAHTLPPGALAIAIQMEDTEAELSLRAMKLQAAFGELSSARRNLYQEEGPSEN